ncbi:MULTISPECIES: aspartate kinase [Kytococcus]|uniref:Aspartokinase n=1 Tax=Kytococcus schroeteri TaxID=138300 RepID=A0A2I1PDH5_9MICO|nr:MULTISPECIES: aspartate kinase [Kytococcus]OFS16107.1 aspartate kinase [Kytococcus sp. HMSC28H12]PKZ42641.1 aspartate kinase [Kytococcus schroeteri]
MSLVVQKYGGSSVADAESIRRVARRIAATRAAGHDVAVVVSAMGDTTDELLDLSREITDSPSQRELDQLLTSGEQISIALLAMALHEMDVAATSFTGRQAGLRTTDAFGSARITEIDASRLRTSLDAGQVAIVAGFQGWTADEHTTTLGRGGSDTTAVAVAAALEADVCEIYSDVDGMFTADPRIVPTAHRIGWMGYADATELAAHGAKILHLRAVEFAQRHDVPLHVRSSFTDQPGTWVSASRDQVPADHLDPQEDPVEEPLIQGVAHTHDQAMLTVVNVPDKPGRAASILAAISEVVSVIDVLGQTHTARENGLCDFSFSLPADDAQRAREALEAQQDALEFAHVAVDENVGKVSVSGHGVRSHAEVPAMLLKALADAGITVNMFTTSEARISVVVADDQVEDAARAIHTAFGLDSDQTAVVHAGTGR